MQAVYRICFASQSFVTFLSCGLDYSFSSVPPEILAVSGNKRIQPHWKKDDISRLFFKTLT